MIFAINEDGSFPGEPLPFLEAFLWFFVTPVGIFLMVWLLVVASENIRRSRQSRSGEDVITRINE